MSDSGTGRDYFREIAAATVAGDLQALAALAMEFAAKAKHDDDRRAAEAAKKRRLRASRPETSRDVPGQDGTGRDIPATLSPLGPPSPPSPAPSPSSPPYNPPSPRTPKRAELASPDVTAVLDHYRRVHPRRRPGAKDMGVVARALRLGYAATELCAAIDGNATDEWHREKGKHELAYVLRDNGKIDDFRAKAETVAPARTPLEEMESWGPWYAEAAQRAREVA